MNSSRRSLVNPRKSTLTIWGRRLAVRRGHGGTGHRPQRLWFQQRRRYHDDYGSKRLLIPASQIGFSRPPLH